MTKGDDNAIGRLGSTDYKQSGDETMRSMQGPTGQNEQSSSEREESSEGFLVRYSTAIGVGSIIFLGFYIVVRMWDEDTFKLNALDALIKILQGIARITGTMALRCERAYNDYVEALH